MKAALHWMTVMALALSGRAAAAGDAQPTNVQPGSVPVAFTLDDWGTTGSEPVEKTAKALLQAGVPEAYGFVNGHDVHDIPDNGGIGAGLGESRLSDLQPHLQP